MALNRERILELLAVLKSSTAGEISVTEGDTTIRLARQPVATAAPVAVGAEACPSSAASPATALAAAADPDEITVKARVVGLFYRGKEPGQTPLVKLGDEVKQGQRLGIIEVLRKPTDINCPVDGVIAGIKSEDGAGVQYGDALFVIHP